MLVRLLYASRAPAPVNAELVDTILEKSRRNNPQRGLTGILCFSDDMFIQVLEGGRDAVCMLFETIIRDQRHHQVQILSFDEIRERRFAGWSMGQVNLSKVNPSLLLKYSDKPVLDPFRCSGSASMALLEELISTGLVVNRGD
jgi:hypothetical protein